MSRPWAQSKRRTCPLHIVRAMRSELQVAVGFVIRQNVQLNGIMSFPQGFVQSIFLGAMFRGAMKIGRGTAAELRWESHKDPRRIAVLR